MAKPRSGVCYLCGHTQQEEITQALARRDSWAAIGKRFGCSKWAAKRHAQHVRKRIVELAQTDVAADNLKARLAAISAKLEAISAAAITDGDNRAAIAALVAELREIELEGRLTGELQNPHSPHVFQQNNYRFDFNQPVEADWSQLMALVMEHGPDELLQLQARVAARLEELALQEPLALPAAEPEVIPPPEQEQQ